MCVFFSFARSWLYVRTRHVDFQSGSQLIPPRSPGEIVRRASMHVGEKKGKYIHVE